MTYSTHIWLVVPSDHMFLDLCGIALGNQSPTKYWRLMVNKANGLKFSHFGAAKFGLVDPTLYLLQTLKDQKHPIHFLQCDNGGKYASLKEHCGTADWELVIQFKFTARDTPQHNHLAEASFPTLCS